MLRNISSPNRNDYLDIAKQSDVIGLCSLKNSIMGRIYIELKKGRKSEREEHHTLVLSKNSAEKETGLSKREREELEACRDRQGQNICLASTCLPGSGPPLRDMVLVRV